MPSYGLGNNNITGNASAPIGIYNPSSENWQDTFDFTRRQGASSVQVSPKDTIRICQLVSSRIWTAHPWQFTLTTAPAIGAVNGQQNYPMPVDCYRLVKAWLRYPQPIAGSSNTVPPFDDPAYWALRAAILSQQFVQGQDVAIDSPAFFFYPLEVVKTLDNNLYPNTVQRIRQITQVGNSGVWRLSMATYVPSDQPFELYGQYQPFAPKIYRPWQAALVAGELYQSGAGWHSLLPLPSQQRPSNGRGDLSGWPHGVFGSVRRVDGRN